MEHNPPDKSDTFIVIVAFAYLAFVIYGSLVPLTFRPMPLNEAWASFQNIRYLDLGIGSLADWVANILLFIPLTFIWLGLFWPGKYDLPENTHSPGESAGVRGAEPIQQSRNTYPKRIFLSLFILTLAIALSLSIEFTQLFFPPRTVSQNDILAEGIGAILGIIAWWWTGPPLLLWLKQLRSTRGATHLAERLLWIYLAILFGYNILPLDLTLSPVEIYHKWNEGRIVLLPFSFVVEDKAQLVYNLITDMMIWIPVSFLWVISGKKNNAQAWRWAVIAAIVLEMLQLLVYSRVTDTTDIITAMLGAMGGIWLVRYWRPENTTTETENKHRWFWIGTAAFIIWSIILCIIFWYPFDFQLDKAFIKERLELFQKVPFHAYYYGTEFRATTEVLHKLSFFLPLGIALSIARIPLQGNIQRRLYNIIAITSLFIVACVIELGQLGLPSKLPDSTDIALETSGALIGYFVSIWVAKRI